MTEVTRGPRERTTDERGVRIVKNGNMFRVEQVIVFDDDVVPCREAGSFQSPHRALDYAVQEVLRTGYTRMFGETVEAVKNGVLDR